MDQAIRIGLTIITDHLKQQLVKVIDQGRKNRQYGTIFSEPVDYINMVLPDYLDVIKRPMDFSTLRSNLMAGEYIYLHQFVKDADLIWSNCRVYNYSQNDQYFAKAASDCEKNFIEGVTRIEELGINSEQYKLLVNMPMPTLNVDEEGPMSTIQLHLLAKKLGELPYEMQVQLTKWYLRQTEQNVPNDLGEHDIKIVFKPQHSQITRELDRLVSRRMEDQRSFLRVTKI